MLEETYNKDIVQYGDLSSHLDTHHRQQLAYLVDEDIKSINQSFVTNMLTQENCSSFILDADLMLVGLPLERGPMQQLMLSQPCSDIRWKESMIHASCFVKCSMRLCGVTFHLTSRHDNLLQLVMGAEDQKDEKIKLCVQLIDDEVLNIVDCSSSVLLMIFVWLSAFSTLLLPIVLQSWCCLAHGHK